jgi:uracil-DNA glycosylase
VAGDAVGQPAPFPDPAGPATPVARAASDVAALAASADRLADLGARSSVCRACPRLVAWREEVAGSRRRSFADQSYWGRPVVGFGDERPRVLILGLAPAAHGGNRTGRIFTGDRSGDWLVAALFRSGLANQLTSVHAGDGLRLDGARMVAAVRCAPPANKPTPGERDTCRPWLVREIELVWSSVHAVVVLGGFAWTALWPALRAAGIELPRPLPPFGHGVAVRLPDQRTVLGCYHPSQQNTFTGKLSAAMLDDVFLRAACPPDGPSGAGSH